MLICVVLSAWSWPLSLNSVKTVASCSVVSVLRRMGGGLVQTVGLTIPNTSRMSKVSYSL